ncbi:MAG: cohesin domain-containing protein, partial [Patescibacteria group bacterium]
MKNISKIFGFILGSLIFVTPALAATTVSLLPQNVDVKVGQSFSVAVSVNPAGVKNYTIKLEMKYPADILEVESFTIAKGWTPWQQPGYYLIDNTNGILIQSAGYPGGLTSTASFGTVVFKAKKSGEAKIQVTGNSMAL